MIYAINKRTKEHRICCPEHGDHMLQPAIVLNADERTVESDADGWIKHDGDECPMPNKEPVEIKFGCGETIKSQCAEWVCWITSIPDDGKEVVAYRPILNSKEEEMSKEWDGEGLPPVGSECEWSDSGRPHKRVLVMGHYGESVWLRIMDSQTPITVHAHYDSFRPLRRAEDKAVDEMAKIIMDAPEDRDDRQDSTNIARALYRAGYRKAGDKS